MWNLSMLIFKISWILNFCKVWENCFMIIGKYAEIMEAIYWKSLIISFFERVEICKKSDNDCAELFLEARWQLLKVRVFSIFSSFCMLFDIIFKIPYAPYMTLVWYLRGIYSGEPRLEALFQPIQHICQFSNHSTNFLTKFISLHPLKPWHGQRSFYDFLSEATPQVAQVLRTTHIQNF